MMKFDYPWGDCLVIGDVGSREVGSWFEALGWRELDLCGEAHCIMRRL